MDLILLPSLSCNYKCHYCFTRSPKMRSRVAVLGLRCQPSADDWLVGIKWLEAEWGAVETVTVSGGEPLLFGEIIQLLVGLGETYGKVYLTSNLAFLTERFFDIPPGKIAMTVSAHLDLHGQIRQEFVTNLRELKTRGYDFDINFVAFPGQLRKYDQVKNLAQEMGCSSHLEPYVDYNASTTSFGTFESPDDQKYFLDNAWDSDRHAITAANRRGRQITNCNVGLKCPTIAANGDIYPCLGMMFEDRFKLGNLFDRRSDFETICKIQPIACDIFCPCALNYREAFQ
ncbi:MAG TPA: radical SAM protein [Acidobacteriota bacterium]|nr:radical SAM protein [Acidobacteriota bacterium]